MDVTPTRPKVGETARLVVTASQPGTCCYLGVEPGNGFRRAERASGATLICRRGRHATEELTSVANRPGTWTAVARCDAGRACDSG